MQFSPVERPQSLGSKYPLQRNILPCALRTLPLVKLPFCKTCNVRAQLLLHVTLDSLSRLLPFRQPFFQFRLSLTSSLPSGFLQRLELDQDLFLLFRRALIESEHTEVSFWTDVGIVAFS
jgi:hypothetical protein